MKKMTKWIFIIVPIVILGALALRMFIFHYHSNTLMNSQPGTQFPHGMRGDRFGHFGGPTHHGVVGQSTVWGLSFMAMLLKIGLIMLGLLLWKLAKDHKVKKIVGASIAGIGILSLLPTIVAIPIVVLMGYFLYKSLQNKRLQVQDLVVAPPFVEPPLNNRKDFLDEWENRVRREEK